MSKVAKQAIKSVFRSPLLNTLGCKESSKFRFDIVVERVIGGSATDYALKWSRGIKTATTRSFRCNPASSEGVEVSQKLSLTSKLHRSKLAQGVSDFDRKDSKLSLVSLKHGRQLGKTVGKVHFDLALFVGVPCASTKHSFQLNAKTKVEVTIICTFLKISNGTGSSMGSDISGMTQLSGEFEDENSDGSGCSDADSLSEADITKQNYIAHPVDCPLSPLTTVPESKGPSQNDQSEAVSNMERDSPNGVRRPEVDGQVATIVETRPLSTDLLNHSYSTLRNGNYQTAFPERGIEQFNWQSADIDGYQSKSNKKSLSEDIVNGPGCSCSSKLCVAKELRRQIDDLQTILATSQAEVSSCTESYGRRISELKVQIETLESDKVRTDTENASLLEMIESLHLKLDVLSTLDDARNCEAEDLLCLQREMDILKGSNQELAEAVKLEIDRATQLTQKLSEAGEEIERLNRKLGSQEEQSSLIKAAYDELSAMHNDLQTQHLKLQDAFGAANLTIPGKAPRNEKILKYLRGTKSEHNTWDSQVTDEEKVALIRENITLKEEIQEKNQVLAKKELEVLDAEKEAIRKQRNLESTEIQCEELRGELAQQNGILESTRHQYLVRTEQLENALETKKGLESRLNALRESHQEEIRNLIAEHVEVSKSHELNTVRNEEHMMQLRSHIKQLESMFEGMSAREDAHKDEVRKLKSTISKLECQQESTVGGTQSLVHLSGGINVQGNWVEIERNDGKVWQENGHMAEGMDCAYCVRNAKEKRDARDGTKSDPSQGSSGWSNIDDGARCCWKQFPHEYNISENAVPIARGDSGNYGFDDRTVKEADGSAVESVVASEALRDANDLDAKARRRSGGSFVLDGLHEESDSTGVVDVRDLQACGAAAETEGGFGGYDKKAMDVIRISKHGIGDFDLLDKVNVRRLFSMLVEAKTKLAFIEEEKRLTSQTRFADERSILLGRLSEYASRLEMKLTRANSILECMMVNQTEGGDENEVKPEAPRLRDTTNLKTGI